MRFILFSFFAWLMLLETHAHAQQAYRRERGFETRIQPITSTETRKFYQSTADTGDNILEEQKKTAQELNNIASMLSDMLDQKKGVSTKNRQQSSPASAGSIQEEMALMRQYLADMKDNAAKQTELHVMMIKLMREQLRVTNMLFGQSGSSRVGSSDTSTSRARQSLPAPDISDRISVRAPGTSKTTDTPKNTSKDDSIWIIR